MHDSRDIFKAVNVRPNSKMKMEAGLSSAFQALMIPGRG